MDQITLLRYGPASHLTRMRLDGLQIQDEIARGQVMAEHDFTLRHLCDSILTEQGIQQKWPRSDCMYCSTLLEEINRCDDKYPWIVLTMKCPSCGWWYSWRAYDEEVFTSIKLYPSVLLMMHSVNDKQLPLMLLFQELNRRQDLLYKVAPSVLEKVVGEILHHVYDCDVHHVGRTGDGGIDLILLHSDTPVAIQVKRRASMDYIEQIGVIREFLGAMVLKGYRRGIFVSTAKRYSRGATELIDAAPSSLVVDRLELWNFEKLFEMYRLTELAVDYVPWLELECYDEYKRYSWAPFLD